MPQYTVSHPRSKSCDTTHAAYSIGLPHLVNIFTLNLVNNVENSQLITTHSVHTLINSLSDLIAMLTVKNVDFAIYRSTGNILVRTCNVLHGERPTRDAL